MPDRSFLDWPFFEPRHRALAVELEAWAARALGDVDHAEPDIAAAEIVRRLGRDGWLQYAVPSPYGGNAERLDVRSLCLIRETLARFDGLADFAFAMQALGSASISLFGTEAQRRRYLPEVAAGTRICAFAMSEPTGGSDAANLRTTAERDGDTFYVTGEKTWISNAGIADHYVTFVRTGEGPGARGLSALVIERGAAGLGVFTPIVTMTPHPLGSLGFNRCAVPADRLLGKQGDGFKVAMATLDVLRSTVGAAALGFARRAFDEALARVDRRESFGQKLADLQLTQARIADMAVDLDTSALLIYRAAWTKDMGAARVTREASMAKLHATEAAQRVIDSAVQLWGAAGVVSGATVETLYREIRALRIYEGTSEIQKLVIAGQALAAHRAEAGA